MKQINLNNWFLNLVLNKYFDDKENNSKLAYKFGQVFKAELKTIEYKDEQTYICSVSDYMMKNIKYTPDPLLFDYYTHPELLQKMIDTNDYSRYGADCDDMACYAYSQLSKHIDKNKLTVVSIIPDLIANISDIQWCHVVAVGLFSLRWSDGWSYIYTIDTNGLNWYQFKLDSYQDVSIDDLLNFKVSGADKQVKDLILDRFSGIYSTKYKLLINHGYPF